MYVVIGCMRTGTSSLAKLLHESGIVMGSHMNHPLPGFTEADYEDERLATKLMQATILGHSIDSTWFSEYVASRRKHAEALKTIYGDSIRGFGVKSNLLPLFWSAFRHGASLAGEPIVAIKTERAVEEQTESLSRLSEWMVPDRRAEYREKLLAMNARVREALAGISADQTVPCKASEGLKLWLLEAVGVKAGV